MFNSLTSVGVSIPSGTASPSKTTITTTIERTTTSENYKLPPPVAKKPLMDDPRYGSPTKKVITDELRYTTVPPPQKTVMEEVRYSATPTKRTVIEEEYRWEKESSVTSPFLIFGFEGQCSVSLNVGSKLRLRWVCSIPRSVIVLEILAIKWRLNRSLLYALVLLFILGNIYLVSFWPLVWFYPSG